LTTIIDLIVVFFFTKPLVTYLAKFSFFNEGHSLSGFSAKSTGLVKSSTENLEAK
jgi:preprotein translocase subunit SecD